MRPLLTYAPQIYRGDTYRWRFALWADAGKTQATDLAGVSAAAVVRQQGGAVVPFAVTITAPNLIDVVLSAAASATLAIVASTWDLELTYPSGDVTTIVGGPIYMRADVTHAAPALAERRLAHVS